MAYKLKALGLALVAVFALSAMMASASQAAEFTPEQETVEGEQVSGTVTGVTVTKHEFSTEGGVVKCSTASFDGKLPKASTTETVTPTYGGCTFAGISAPVDMNGCAYVFTAASASTLATQVECPTGAHISVTAPNCTITVFPQSFAASMITAANSGAAPDMHLTATIDVTGIEYEFDPLIAGDQGCPAGVTVTSHRTNGTYKGVATFHHGTVS